MEGLGSLLEGLVFGSALFWPILTLWTTLWLEDGDVPYFGGGESVWVLIGGFIFIWDIVFLGMGRIICWQNWSRGTPYSGCSCPWIRRPC